MIFILLYTLCSTHSAYYFHSDSLLSCFFSENYRKMCSGCVPFVDFLMQHGDIVDCCIKILHSDKFKILIQFYLKQLILKF